MASTHGSWWMGGGPGPGWLGKYPKTTHDRTVASIQHRIHREGFLSPDGCSSHNTAMAVAALGGFLYVLAEHPPAGGELWQSSLAPAVVAETNVSTPATGR